MGLFRAKIASSLQCRWSPSHFEKPNLNNEALRATTPRAPALCQRAATSRVCCLVVLLG
jgi:hypothetical protein